MQAQSEGVRAVRKGHEGADRELARHPQRRGNGSGRGHGQNVFVRVS